MNAKVRGMLGVSRVAIRAVPWSVLAVLVRLADRRLMAARSKTWVVESVVLTVSTRDGNPLSNLEV